MTIEDLKRLESEATERRWRYYDGVERHYGTGEQMPVCPPLVHEEHPGGSVLCEGVGQGHDPNMALIAALRNSAPALLACADLVAEMADGECWDPQVIHDGHGTSIETEHEEDCGECLPCRARTLMAAFKASP